MPVGFKVAGTAAARSVGRSCSAGELGDVDPVTAIQGHVIDGFRSHDLGNGTVLRLQQRRSCVDLHGLGGRADAELEGNGNAGLNADDNVILPRWREARCICQHRIGADLDGGKGINTTVVGSRFELQPRGVVCNGHDSPRNHRARTVGDDARDRSLVGLGPAPGAQEQHC